jgi:hypothetical protein
MFKTLSELLRHRKTCKLCLTIRADKARANKEGTDKMRKKSKKIVWR